MVNKYNRKKFQFGGGADMGIDRKVPKVPNVNPTYNKEKAKTVLDKEKSGPINPKQNVTTGPMKAKPARMPSVVKGIIQKAGKFTKKNPDQVKKTLNDKRKINALMEKIKKLRKRTTKMPPTVKTSKNNPPKVRVEKQRAEPNG